LPATGSNDTAGSRALLFAALGALALLVSTRRRFA
jgi:LPXTG-motif cell wall-anchored protein